ncbi:MAG: 50S ribosomal protein L9 [Candidatus Sumerlaeales bacterium]|nr:50S ribosomal protein L9 [Candidatus Sumerlaeales bacterium]
MEVILFDNVKDLGHQGEVVKVATGYFRNYLGPQKLAAEATSANMKRFEKMRKKAAELSAQRLADAQKLAETIKDLVVTIKAKAGDSDKLFGSVSSSDIAEALEAMNYKIDRHHIKIAEAIKTLGEHEATLELHSEVEVAIKVMVERA